MDNMADEERKPDAVEEATEAPKRRRSALTIGIFGGVMVVEGLAVFLCMKFLGADADPTFGVEGLANPTTQAWAENIDLEVADLRVLNTSGPRTMIYNIRVDITVRRSEAEEAQKFLEGRKSTIKDALSRVIRRAEEKHLNEPGLETIRRQLLFELNRLIGNETTIEQVLIPDFTQLPTGV